MIETGDPVVVVNAKGLEDCGISVGDKGWANSVATIPGDKTYIFFMPADGKEMYVVESDRLEVDEEAKSIGLELNQDTIAKGD
jgi:hypothetical protein